MLRKLATHSLIAVTLLIAAPSFADSDPSMHQVYIAAEAGKFHEAQTMMDKVLRDHPNSGKAHFIEAELLAKQGLISQAQAELNTAERLAPNLPFAKPQAVQHLKSLLSGQHQNARQTYQTAPHAKSESGTSWVFLLIVGVLAFFIIRFVWRMIAGASNRVSLSKGYPPTAPNGMGNMPMGGMGGGMMPNNGGGMGSGIMGGLATGAAMGAGMVAGQALAHHFLDGNENHPDHSNNNIQPNNDMGGSDFGISDSSSWDDNSGGGGSEWD